MSYVGKIMCVGNEGVRKTAVTGALMAKKPRQIRKYTEGLDLHIHRAAINRESRK